MTIVAILLELTIGWPLRTWRYGMNEPQEMEEAPKSVASYGLLHQTRAYNRMEITLEEWLRLLRKWVEKIIAAHDDKR